MGIVTKRNGKILMILGMLLIVTGLFGSMMLYAMFGEESAYTPLAGFFIFLLFFIGPPIALVGIPLFIIGAKRLPSKLMDLLKSGINIQTRAKISFLAQQLAINERDVVDIISRLRSNGQPISIDHSTMDAIYNPELLASSAKIRKPSMTLYEKLTVIGSLLSILVSIIVALLK
jgi:hypothetical protein